MIDAFVASQKPDPDYPYDDLIPNRPLPMPNPGLPLDEGIKEFVRILRFNGIETIQSCQGGEGHSSDRPYVWFLGEITKGFHAFHVASLHGFHVQEIRMCWQITDGLPVSQPYWEMILHDMERW